MQLNLTPQEFADFVMIFLMDKIVNKNEVVTGNPRFENFIEKAGSVIKPTLVKQYLDMDSITRVNYKRIKDVLEGANKTHRIRIVPSDEEEIKVQKKKDGILKKVIKKIISGDEIYSQEKQMLNEFMEEL